MTLVSASCVSGPIEVYGGDVVRYSYCVIKDESELASIPVITKRTLRSAEFVSVDMDHADMFSVSQESFDLTEVYRYKGYNIYFLVLRLRCKQMENIVTAKIKSITLKLNGEDTVLSTPHFNVCNGIEGISSENYNDGTMGFGGLGYNSVVSSYLPSKERPTQMGLTVKSAIEINSFHLLDHLLIHSFELNGTEYDPNSINCTINANSDFVFTYSLKYADGCDETNIIRTARIVIFTEDGIKKAFIDGAGTYIYLGFQDQKVIKNYIDTL